ncbi:MAG: DUF1573 domain-containing protein [Prolixibacteraceae bacterium]|nr:DUF1573 domain-containing protein [Prolixibacteraceae bacterium]MBN2772936.1 DUF1573 domain-containing protein [Prolixibacteraceae bacterium]
MKGKQILYLILIVFPFSVFYACKSNRNEDIKKDIQTEGLTEFEFNKEIHNFGELISGEVVIYSFKLKNTGNNTLLIKNTECDCNCIKARCPEKSLQSGETGIIEVEFDTAGLFGKQYKSVAVEMNTKEKTIYLAVIADVKNDQLEINY